MNVKTFLTLLFIIYGSLSVSAQRSKKIRVDGDYHHAVTKTLFPASFEGFSREDLVAFDKENAHIRANYRSTDRNTNISVVLYPAGLAMETRFSGEYWRALRIAATSIGKKIAVVHKHVRVAKDGYGVLGITGTFQTKETCYAITLFECGRYFLKYEISLDERYSALLPVLNEKLTTIFSPSDVVKVVPLQLGAQVHIAPAVINDSVLLDPVIAAAEAKMKWVDENVDSLERCSGFPGLYLEEQAAAIIAMLDKWKSIDHPIDAKKERNFIELSKIRDSGFLNEYLIDNYNAILYYPPTIVPSPESYGKWKNWHAFKVSVSGPAFDYIIGYERSYE